MTQSTEKGFLMDPPTSGCVSRDCGESIWDKLWFSCEVVHYGKALISIVRRFSASVKGFLSLGGGLGTRS